MDRRRAGGAAEKRARKRPARRVASRRTDALVPPAVVPITCARPRKPIARWVAVGVLAARRPPPWVLKRMVRTPQPRWTLRRAHPGPATHRRRIGARALVRYEPGLEACARGARIHHAACFAPNPSHLQHTTHPRERSHLGSANESGSGFSPAPNASGPVGYHLWGGSYRVRLQALFVGIGSLAVPSTSMRPPSRAIRQSSEPATGPIRPTARGGSPTGERALVAARAYPISTVPTAMITPSGASVGSLQVLTGSPIRAAAFPSKNTLVLPSSTVPMFDGGFWNGPPDGT